MALSNWLTRDEWNAVYFAGIKPILNTDKEYYNLGNQLRLGIVELVKAGYKFRGIDADKDGNVVKRVQCCDGNETVLVEIYNGEFDYIKRAKETLKFTAREIPSLDLTWVQEIIEAMADKGESNV